MGGLNSFESALGRSGNTLKVSHKLISKQCLGPRISERSDHTTLLYRIPVSVNNRAVRISREAESRIEIPIPFISTFTAVLPLS
jgi:hypothetical protein